ncbi:hypothetical protein NQD34_018215 [Periophthalmus magnuspinnatus]|nr:hypothetical protein NQD34_018215 [Periophthalmus magnuspinnatus]
MAKFILSFTRMSRPGPFAEKQHDVSTPWCSLDATQHPFSSKHDILSFYQKVLFWFHFTILHSPSPLLDHPNALTNFWTCTGLSRGTRLAQDLSPWRRSVSLMVAFVTLVPALCRSFTRSARVVLGFFLTVLVIILTYRVRSCVSPRSREIISGLVCLPFSNNCSHS